MDELPERLVEAVGDATAIELIDVGGGDIVAVTRAKTYCYRSEGLLSDETVDRFPHDIERLTTEAGRRKTTIHFETIDGKRSLTVPGRVADDVIEAILEGVLRTTGVIDDETIQALFRFSELTFIVTDQQLLKHVGGAVWNDEYEAFAYEELTDLDFEEGSVATQVIVKIRGRRQRVKVPNEHAGRVRQEVQSAVFEYYDVSSLGGLRAEVREETEDEKESDADEGDTESEASAMVGSDWSPPADQDMTNPESESSAEEDDGSTVSEAESDGDETEDHAGEATAADVDALAEQVETLTETVERQTDLIEAQQETLEKLVDELRRGR